MPPRRFARGRRRRFKRKKKNTRFRRSTGNQYATGGLNIYRNPSAGLLPTKFPANLKYAMSGTLTIVAGNTPVRVFRANGMFDPDLTGGGHQPMGFDQLKLWYNNYTVIGSKLRVQFISAVDDTSIGQGIVVGLSKSRTSTGRNWEEYTEQGGTKQTYMAVGGGSNIPVTMTMTASPKKYFGITNIMDEESLKGNTLADPVKDMLFHVFASSLGAASTQNIHFKVEIDYACIWTNPVQVGQS